MTSTSIDALIELLPERWTDRDDVPHSYTFETTELPIFSADTNNGGNTQILRDRLRVASQRLREIEEEHRAGIEELSYIGEEREYADEREVVHRKLLEIGVRLEAWKAEFVAVTGHLTVLEGGTLARPAELEAAIALGLPKYRGTDQWPLRQ